jgi:hypothetical protein
MARQVPIRDQTADAREASSRSRRTICFDGNAVPALGIGAPVMAGPGRDDLVVGAWNEQAGRGAQMGEAFIFLPIRSSGALGKLWPAPSAKLSIR